MIHQTAIIHPEAKIHPSVKVGAFSIIGEHVQIAEGTIVDSHVVIDGHTRIGKENHFFPFCSIGAPPQDLTYKGEPTVVEIGDNNVFREYVSVHRGTTKDQLITKVGNNCFLMAKVHLGHDVIIGNKVIMANSVNLAGHVTVGDNCIIGGGTNISQFVVLGRASYIGGASGVDRDIPSFCTAYGNRIKLKGINIVGLRRQKYEKNHISEMVDFFRTMETAPYAPRAFIEHQDLWSEYRQNPLVLEFVKFIETSEVGIAPFMS